MNYTITLIGGDGIGPEVTQEARRVLEALGEQSHHRFTFLEAVAGGIAIDTYGESLPRETLDLCKQSDAVLLGAVGGPRWDHLPGDQRPERALLGLRKELQLYANLRPAILFEALASACPLKPELISGGLDLLVVRELTGGIYFGEKGRKETDLGKQPMISNNMPMKKSPVLLTPPLPWLKNAKGG